MRRRHNELNYVASTHFITTVTNVRGDWFVDDDVCRYLLELFEGYRAQQELDCLGYVLMPDHLHVLLRQTTEEGLVTKAIQGFKSVSSRKLRIANYPARLLWRTHYDDVPVPGSEAVTTKIKYMHANPVARGIVSAPEEYAWSSAREILGIEKGIVTLTERSHS
jgi:putative transposase